MEWVLLALLVLAIPVMAIAGFFMALNARRRIAELEQRLAIMEAGQPAGATTAAATPTTFADDVASVPAEPAAGQPAEPPAVDSAVPPFQPEGADAAPPEPAIAAAVAAPPRQSLEEVIGTRWAVWLGGIALALGGLFLVRFAIEEGFFGPAARVISGALFSLALMAAGEWMRRRDAGGVATTVSLGRLPPAPVPAVLTAAGTLAAFATAYAAHALYDMIGPATAFVLLGAIGIGTMAAAALHGPWLAALGLVAAFVAPLLVSSADPKPWPVVIYLAVVAASAYGLSRIRLWLWLAVATALGSGLWAFVIIEASFRNHLEAMVHILVQTALAAGFVAWDVHRRDRDEEAEADPVALAILAGFAALAAYKLQVSGLGSGRPVFAAAMLALLWGTALRIPAVAAGGLVATGVVAAALFAWPLASEIARQPVTVLPGAPSNPPLPDALWQLLVLAIASGAALAGGALLRLVRTPVIAPVATGFYAAAGVAGPLALLVMAWWTVTDFDRSIPFALVAGAMAAGFVATAAFFKREAADGGNRSARFGLEACAAGAIAAIAAGLTMVLDKGGLTVALALSAAGAAWVTTREPVGTLRYAVGTLGVAVLGRLIWDPTIVSGDIGSIPVFNWLLWGYGVPALSFGLASVWLRRQKDDQVVALAEALAIAFTAFLAITQIRHAITGTLDAREPGHLEAGLQAFASLTLGGVLVWLEITRRSLVIRIGSYVLGATALGIAVLGLVVAVNPLLNGSERVGGGAIFNTLLPAYLMPAIAAVVLSVLARGRRPAWFCWAALGLGFVLQFLWMVAEIRHLFQGEVIVFSRTTSDAEIYAYSAAFLVMGLALLAYGIVRGSQTARLASGVYILLTVGKVFLIDMDGLTGVWRALSFIGLGLALVGIGLVYQKLVFGRPPPAPPAAPGEGPAAAA
ncbi:MAG: DUF2339 domain-containing protein [Burkholderiales bacterium]|nr:DUF2339 domain-containing protein [Burkholderiales bacterium]